MPSEAEVIKYVEELLSDQGNEFIVAVKYNLKKVANIQPADTTVIDLSKDKDNLLAAMHHKTRYNIRLAGRKGVEINSLGMHCLDEFWRLMSQTTARDKFRAHPKDYYEKIIQAMGEASDAKAWFGTAYYNNRLAAVNLMVSFGKTVTYLHGASADKYRNVMAPHLLQWEMIKKAKFAGKKWYDFWGVAPEGIEDHPWAGVTRFKKGFSGQELHYGGTFDLVVSPVKYRVYSLVRYLKK